MDHDQQHVRNGNSAESRPERIAGVSAPCEQGIGSARHCLHHRHMALRTSWLAAALAASLLLASCGGGDTTANPEQLSAKKRALGQTGVQTVAPPALSGTWVQLPNPAVAQGSGHPFGRAWTEMTWDSSRQEMVIFGGNSTIEYANDIWSYNATSAQWTNIDPHTWCPGNYGFTKINGTDDSAFRYDPVNNGYWVFGGVSGYRCLSFTATRTAGSGSAANTIVDPTLEGTTADAYTHWRIRSGTTDLGVTSYDPVAKRLTLQAAIPNLAEGTGYKLYASLTGGTWFFDSVSRSWTGFDTPVGYAGPTPGGRIAPAVAYSTAAEAFVLFGGNGAGAPDRSVWRLDVRTKQWTQLPVAGGALPPPTREMLNSLVYDKANDVFVMFGGLCLNVQPCTTSTHNGQTWVYRLATNTWVNMNPPSAPSARAKHLMTYDEKNGVVVLFGGDTVNGLANDTWYYHFPSNTWRQLVTPAAPSARFLSQVTYDPVKARTVVYSGSSYGYLPADIWALSLNAPPEVSLVSPATGAVIAGGTDIAIEAQASDAGGSVAKVEFFANGVKLGERTALPFTFVWQNAPAGQFVLTAVATDDQGVSTTSEPVSMQVTGSYNAPTAAAPSAVGDTAEFYAPSNVTLSAAIGMGESPIHRVEYFIGSTKIAVTTSAPYSALWLNVAAGTYPIRAVVTDVRGVQSRSAEVLVTVRDRTAPMVNVALASNGASVLASSVHSAGYPSASVIDGRRHTAGWGSDGGWNDATDNAYPDWVEVGFGVARSISTIRVFTLRDDYSSTSEPTLTSTFSLYGIRDFQVQYWTGSAWAVVPGGSVTGNTLVWRNFSFAPISTSRIRVWVTGSLAGYSRIAEIEAWAETGANAAPSVALTSPAGGAVFAAPAQIPLAASAFDSDGSIARVEFFAGTTKIGESTTAPYVMTWAGIAPGTYRLTAAATDNQGATTFSAETAVTVSAASGGGTNVALAINGSAATASSSYSSSYGVGGVIDGVVNGRSWAQGGGWNDATANSYPDWVQVSFPGVRTIDRISVTTLSDNFATDSDPTGSTTFTRYGVTDFEVQYWTGSAWTTVQGGSVSGNSLVVRTFNFAPVSTDRIRVLVTGALAGYARIVEISAWTVADAPPPAGTNVALGVNGGVATASSSYSANYAVAAINDAVINGRNWAQGGGWNDATEGSFPDWVQVTFAGVRTIDRITVVTLSDNFASDGDPSAATSFTRYGLTDFEVQYWTGAAWATVPGGTISGNRFVLRDINFASLSTDRIRVLVTGALFGYSRVVELSARSAGSD